MKVVFRVDSSLMIGAGHVMRCLTLADELSKHNVEVLFICRCLSGNLVNLIKKKYQVCSLPQPHTTSGLDRDSWLGVDWSHDAQETSQVLKKSNGVIDWLIVDHYSLDVRWQKKIRSYVKHIMVIDDLALRQSDCDLLLDQTYGRSEREYLPLVPRYCRLLLGAEYALLRPQFAQKRQKAQKRRCVSQSVLRILISMGGMDSDNTTGIVLSGLEQIVWSIPIKIDIILGKNAPHLKEVQKKARNSTMAINVFSNVKNMEDFTLKADLAIGAGGTTSWERCCLGLPSLVVMTADNQQRVIDSLCTAGAVVTLGESSILTPGLVASGMKTLLAQKGKLAQMQKSAFNIVDGMGVARVAEIIIETNYCDIILREASLSDCDLIYGWQSDPNTRKFCRNPAIPTRNEHENWFQAVLKNKKQQLFIIDQCNNSCGLIRLDEMDGKKNTFEISILTAPDFRGKGIAKKALGKLRYLKPNLIFAAEIMTENRASIAIFKFSGFKQVDETWYLSKPVIETIKEKI